MRGPRTSFVPFVTVGALAALLLGGCGGRTDDEGEVFTDPSRPIDVSVDDRFTIELAATPSTGYTWELTGPVDDSVVRSEGSDHEPGEGDVVGAPGKQSFRFQAVADGTATISLQYVRPWETDVAPAETSEFTVNVS